MPVLTAFQLDDQVFRLVRWEKKQLANGKTINIAIWRTRCPECRTPFTQERRNRGFMPARSTTRRCVGCRKTSRVKSLGEILDFLSEPDEHGVRYARQPAEAETGQDVPRPKFSPPPPSAPSSPPSKPVAKVRLFRDK